MNKVKYDNDIYKINVYAYIPSVYERPRNTLIFSDPKAHEIGMELPEELSNFWLTHYEDLRFIVIYQVTMEYSPLTNKWDSVTRTPFSKLLPDAPHTNYFYKCFELSKKTYNFVPKQVLIKCY